MSQLNILFGFEESKFQRNVERALQGLGYEVNIVCKYSKMAVADYLKKHPEFEHVVLKEIMGRNAYTENELAELTEEHDINVIVVLASRHKGTSYMETLYAAGITGALFQDGNSTDASVERVIDLLLHKRRRVDARKYYGIGEKANIKLDKISDGKLSDLLHALDDSSYGDDPGSRFAQLCQQLSVPQVVEFIGKMPIDTRQNLERFDNYWMVITALQAHGVTIKSRKYADGVKNFSKRSKVGAGKENNRIEDNTLDKEYVPTNAAQDVAPQSAPAQDDGLEFEEVRYEEEPSVQSEPVPEEAPAEEIKSMVDDLPPTTDWRELKRREKWRKREIKQKAKADRMRAKYTPMPKVESPKPAPKKSAPVKEKRQPNPKKEQAKRDFILRFGILIGIVLFVVLMVIVGIGVNYMTKSNAMAEEQEQEVLTAQMNDLAEIRSGEPSNTLNTEPVTNSVADGEQLMGIAVMDVINTDMQLFYVVNLDGSLYTYEGGGATSSEIDVNSMYYARMLSSGRFAFFQQ